MIKYFIFAFSFTLILGCKNNGKETIRNYDKIEDKVYFNITDVKQFELDELSKLTSKILLKSLLFISL